MNVRYVFRMSKWPHTIPADLKASLEDIEGHRYTVSTQDRWGSIRDWLVKHGIG